MSSEKYPADLLSGIAAFVQVGQSTSFTEAARRLNISASGVSRSMSRLEERLGARLINRTTRHLSLTPEGALYFERCRQILKSLEEAAEALGESRNASEGRLSVRLPKSFGRALVIPALAEYSVRYPKISLAMRGCARKCGIRSSASPNASVSRCCMSRMIRPRPWHWAIASR